MTEIIVEGSGGNAAATRLTPAVRQKILGWRFPLSEPRVERQRLIGALQQAEGDIRVAAAAAKDAEARTALRLAAEKLDDAVTAAVRRASFQAWDLHHQIERLVAASDPDPRRRELLFARYAAEADEKLVGWRKKFVGDVQAGEHGTAGLVQVMQMVHEGSQNAQQKITLVREQMRYLLLLIVAALLTILAVARSGGFDWVTAPGSLPELETLMGSGTLIGFFGGLMSAAFALTKTDSKLKIPAIRSSFSIQFLRAFLGATAAIPVILLVKAGLISLGNQEPAMLAALCFLAGFSERWFMKQLEEHDKAAPKP